MSKERDLLVRWLDDTIFEPEELDSLMDETKELLAQPEPFMFKDRKLTDSLIAHNDMYKRGYARAEFDLKREPIDTSKERELLKECRLMLDNPINGTAGRNLQIKITELLAPPEQDKAEAVMPNGVCVSNVYDAYEEGRKSVMSDVASPTLARLIEEVKNDSKTRHVYNRVHNRHNR